MSPGTPLSAADMAMLPHTAGLWCLWLSGLAWQAAGWPSPHRAVPRVWTPRRSATLAGSGQAGWLLPLMLPQRRRRWLPEFSYAMLETLAMAFLGTVLASLAAMPLGSRRQQCRAAGSVAFQAAPLL